jgi:hypothetical protein
MRKFERQELHARANHTAIPKFFCGSSLKRPRYFAMQRLQKALLISNVPIIQSWTPIHAEYEELDILELPTGINVGVDFDSVMSSRKYLAEMSKSSLDL